MSTIMIQLFGGEEEWKITPAQMLQLPYFGNAKQNKGKLDSAIIGIVQVGYEFAFLYSQVKLIDLYAEHLNIEKETDKHETVLEYMKVNDVGMNHSFVSHPIILQDYKRLQPVLPDTIIDIGKEYEDKMKKDIRFTV